MAAPRSATATSSKKRAHEKVFSLHSKVSPSWSDPLEHTIFLNCECEDEEHNDLKFLIVIEIQDIMVRRFGKVVSVNFTSKVLNKVRRWIRFLTLLEFQCRIRPSSRYLHRIWRCVKSPAGGKLNKNLSYVTMVTEIIISQAWEIRSFGSGQQRCLQQNYWKCLRHGRFASGL